MRVPSLLFGRLLTITAGVAACVAACQAPEQYFRDGGTKTTGKGGSGGTNPAGMGGTIGLGGGGGTFPTGGTGGTISTGQGGKGGTFGNGGTSGTGGRGGSGGSAVDAGMEAPPPPCTTCSVTVHYNCRGTDSNQASFVLIVENTKPVTIASGLTVRYWYTTDDVPDQMMNCDYAANGCPTGSFVAVTPSKMNANVYLELAIGSLAGFTDTGEIQLRIHTGAQYLPGMQTDDYSFDCSMMGTSVVNPKITAYVNGTLVGGTEPQ